MGKPRWRDDRESWSVHYRDRHGRWRQKLFKPLDASKRAIDDALSAAWQYKRQCDRRNAQHQAGLLSEHEIAVAERGRTPIADVLDDYRHDMKARRLSHGRINNAVRIPERLFNDCDWHTPVQLDAARVQAWLARFKPSTANIYLELLRTFAHWLHRHQYLSDHRLAALQPARRGKPERPYRAFDRLEWQLFIDCPEIPADRRLYYLVAGRTGIRHSELRRLTWSDLDLDAGTVTISADKAKAGRTDTIPIPAHVLARLRLARQSPAAPLFRTQPTRRTFESDVQRARRHWISQAPTDAEAKARRNAETLQLESPRGRLYRKSLRKTLGTHMALAGAHIQVTQQMLRHRDVRLTTSIYTDAGLLETRQALDALDTPPPAQTDAG